MNRTYTLVWNPCLGAWNVTSEHARRRSKGAGAVLAAALLLPSLTLAADLPTGGQVASGSGAIGLPSQQQMVIEQNSQKLAIDWHSFDIGAGNKVTFNQPGRDAVALNRVLGADGSKIMGQLEANGQVFIVNPNGVVFGKDAEVNVGGLVASTLDLSVNDFEAGHYQFKGAGNNASVVNQGRLSAQDGGAIALLGGRVSNQGLIVANEGTVALAAANNVTLDFSGDGLLNLQVDEGTAQALAENRQLIQADGGKVLLTAAAADAVVKAVVNNDGVIQASSLAEKDGKILLLADMQHGELNASGSLAAHFVETSAAAVNIDQELKVDTQGGEWLIDPVDITIDQNKARAIQTALNSGNVTVTTANGANNTGWGGSVNGSGTDAGDIHVNADISYSKNKLTLNADNHLNVNAKINVNGEATLALNYGGTVGNSATPVNANSQLKVKGQVNFAQGGANLLEVNGQRFTVINDVQALQAIGTDLSGRYALGRDINAQETANWNSGAGFNPLGSQGQSFDGVFDGLGHSISELTINRANQDYVGLFGATGSGSLIQHVGIVDGQIVGRDYVGALSGRAYGQTIATSANVTVQGRYRVGGLVGEHNGVLSESYAAGEVSGTSYVGGLVGVKDYGSTRNSYASGAVEGGYYVGGLIGYNSSSALSYSFASGEVTGISYVGALIGLNYASTPTHVFYATDRQNIGAVGSGSVGDASGKTLAELADINTFSAWDKSLWGTSTQGADSTQNGYQSAAASLPFLLGVTRDQDKLWHRTLLFSAGLGNSANPWQVANWQQLQHINTNSLTLAGHYKLVADLNSQSVGYQSLASSSANLGLGWQPIGGASTWFRGVFDGQYHTISDLYINRPTQDYVGLFGLGYGAKISHVGLNGGSVVGNSAVGALAGRIGTSPGTNTSVENVYASVEVTGTGDNVGGLLGQLTADGGPTAALKNAYATGAVNGVNRVGGLVGSASGSSYGVSNLTNVYATGRVTATGANVGGLLGLSQNNVNVSGFYQADPNVAGRGTAKSEAELKALKTYAGWSIDDLGGTASVWRIYDGYSGPLLRGFLKTANVTVDSSGVTDKTYDGSVATGTLNYSSALANNLLGNTLSYSSKSKNAGTYHSADGSLLLQGLYSDQQGYDINYNPTLSLTIDKADLQVTGVSVNDKTYDTNTRASLSSRGHVQAFGTDVVNLAGTAVATFADKNAGTAKAVTVSGYQLSGTDAANYNLLQPTGVTATINKADLQIAGVQALSKTYDGTRDASLRGTAFVRALGGDAVSLAGTGVALFVDKNAGAGKAVEVSGYSLTGLDAGNYNLLQPAGLSATINRANVLVTGVHALDKTYDATTSARLDGMATVSALGADEVSVVGAGSAVFANKNAGASKAVSVTGFVLSGADAGNYNLIQPSGLTATIHKADLQVVGLQAVDKIYDGNHDGILVGAAFVSALGADAVSVVGTGSAFFTDKNAGSGKAVSVSGYQLAGVDAGNYHLLLPTDLTASIVQARITSITGITAETRVYNGTTDATLNTDNAAFDGIIAGDSLSVGTATGAFSDKNAGVDKQVAITGLTLTGADAANYQLTDNTASTTATISQATINAITGITAETRVYNGTADATLNIENAVFDRVLSGESLTVGTATGAFSDKNAGANKQVAITGLTLTGADAANYQLADTTASTTATISQATINAITGITADNRVYNGTTDATLNTDNVAFNGIIAGDSLTVGTATGAFSDKNAGVDKQVAISGLTLTGADAANYQLADTAASTTATISQATINAITGITADNRVYNGTTDARLNIENAVFSGMVTGDSLTVGKATGAFNDKNAGVDKRVAITGLTLDGIDAANYQLADNTASTTATISQATINAITGITADNRVYNGTTDAALNTGNAEFTGMVAGDSLTVGTAAGAFSDKNAGVDKQVAISGLTLTGADAANYQLEDTTASTTATISQATINAITGITAETRVYNGTTDATLSTGNAEFTGMVAGDSLTVGEATGAFSDKHAGANKQVAISGLTLAGSDADNYQLLDTTATTHADISRKALIVSADSLHSIQERPVTLTYSLEGLVQGDEVTQVELSSTGTGRGVRPGNYVISASNAQGTGLSNYEISYQAGNHVLAAQVPPDVLQHPAYIARLHHAEPPFASSSSAARQPLATLNTALAAQLHAAFNGLPIDIENGGLRLPEGL